MQALLDAHAAALLRRDRAGFLAAVDPTVPGLRARQGAAFDALAPVPLAAWSYRVGGAPPTDPARWTPRVVLAVGLAGSDQEPGETEPALTLARRAGRWWLVDDGLGPAGKGPAQLWDLGPVAVVRGTRSLVLGRPPALAALRRLAAEADAVVPRVTSVWGTGWAQRVTVVVPADATELGRLVTSGTGPAGFAALTVALPVRGGTELGADRVYVDPGALAGLSDQGRQIVLTHEVTHVAARASTGALTPAWLAEGLADHVGLSGTGLPVPEVAAELAEDVRAGRLPARLPGPPAFAGGAPGLAQAYQQAWLAVELLWRRHGGAAVLALYRDLGARRAGDPAAVLDETLRADLGTTTAALTADWRADLSRQLG